MDRRSFLALSGGAALAASLHPNLILADETVAQIYQQSFVIDSSGEAADFTEGLPLSEKSLKAVSESGLTAINWTVSMPTFEETVPYIAFVQQIAETYPSQFLLVRKHADLATAKKDKKLGLIMAFQHPQPFRQRSGSHYDLPSAGRAHHAAHLQSAWPSRRRLASSRTMPD